MNLTQIRAGAFVLGLALPSLAFAQSTPVYQSGTMSAAHNLAKITRNGQVQDVGGLAGDSRGRGINPFLILDSLGDAFCADTAARTGTYHSLCIGHNSSGDPVVKIDSVEYPFLGVGNGNVVGPGSSTTNELASFNSNAGTLLRQGAATLTDSKSAAIAADGAGITAISKSGITAQTIYENTIGPGNVAAPSYDAVRGVADQPIGSTALDVNGVAGYVVNRNSHAGPAQVSGGLKGIAIAAADNSSVWGMFTIVSDKEGQAVSAGAGRSLYNEVDYVVNSPGTTVGFIVGAAFLSQPVSAAGPTVLKPSGVGIWNYAFGTGDGCCTVAYRIGAAADSGTSIASQPLDFQYRDAGGVAQHTTLSQTAGGMLLATSGTASSGSFVIPGGSVYGVGDLGGYQINQRAVLAGSGTGLSIASDAAWTTITLGNTTASLNLARGLQIGGPTGGDKGVGTLNVASTIWANGVQGVNCAAGVVAGTVTVANGIVTHC